MRVDPTELNAAITEAKAAGRLTERLAVLGMQIARGCLSAEKFSGYPEADREDIFGAWTVSFVKNWHRLDPEGNPHAYITTMVANCWRMHERSTQRRLRKEHAQAEVAYAEEMENCARFIRVHQVRDDELESLRRYARKIKKYR